MIDDSYVINGEAVQIIATVRGYPLATLTWEFLPCDDIKEWHQCLQNHDEPEEIKVSVELDYFS